MTIVTPLWLSSSFVRDESHSRPVDTRELEAFITQTVSFLQKTNAKLIEEDQIDSWEYKRGIALPEVLSKIQI